MTPKEKALELVEKFRLYLGTDAVGEEYFTSDLDAKRSAYIAVNEMIAFVKHAFSYINIELATPSIVYLEEVKQEIEKL